MKQAFKLYSHLFFLLRVIETLPSKILYKILTCTATNKKKNQFPKIQHRDTENSDAQRTDKIHVKMPVREIP